MCARFKQGAQGFNLGGNRCGREIVHAFKRQINGQISITGQGVGDGKGGSRCHRAHTVIKGVDVNFQELAIGNTRLRNVGFS